MKRIYVTEEVLECLDNPIVSNFTPTRAPERITPSIVSMCSTPASGRATPTQVFDSYSSTM